MRRLLWLKASSELQMLSLNFEDKLKDKPQGFGNPHGWQRVQLAVYDFDSLTESDFMGQAGLDEH